ncbi:DUF262 domain-containing HNH endonuclease family protein [Brachyspira pilosicoli]|uniref:DUF262 domain-containing protein n=1 Tax=Brachyspira pilosicoli TaxID=52584 RepID=UPI0025428BDD|nr:DUF262 domain-containing protein [Brachyspira pilosicoli]WIH85461.1 DUF262 domain-containing HNH endonuclease family protein [Brachyspira pilosicoli]
MSYKSNTIKNIIDGIYERNYVLPAIQREFVWKTEQIVKLFDSILRGYPIGSFLFWNINSNNINDYVFYDFIKDYHERDFRHNPKHNVIQNKNIISILDGQQRLTSLYIGLRGSFSYKEKHKKYNKDASFPKRFLYINIFHDIENDSIDISNNEILYDLKFMTEEEANNNNDDKNYWFKISNILNMEMKDISKFTIKISRDEEKQNNVLTILSTIHQYFCVDEIINFYEETEQDIEKVLNIFTRINSGGTILNYSDLLLSTATALWEHHDARDEINNLTDEINRIGIDVNKDFIMKASLVLSDLDIAFKVKNFNKANTQKIENNWKSIKQFLPLTSKLIINSGYKNEFITSHNALMPIAYYLKKINADDDFLTSVKYTKDREIIIKWFAMVLVSKSFGGSSDSILNQYRDIINNSNSNYFPIEEAIDKFKNTNRSIYFDDNRINTLIDESYFGDKQTFSLLMLIQNNVPNNIDLSIDHIHPQKLFNKKILKNIFSNNEEDIEYYKHNIVNLEILSSNLNSSKGDKPLEDWINTDDCKQYSFLIPSNLKDYSINNIFEFYEERRNLLIKKLNEKLK